jgi:hypothetical protein
MDDNLKYITRVKTPTITTTLTPTSYGINRVYYLQPDIPENSFIVGFRANWYIQPTNTFIPQYTCTSYILIEGGETFCCGDIVANQLRIFEEPLATDSNSRVGMNLRFAQALAVNTEIYTHFEILYTTKAFNLYESIFGR